MAAEVDMALHQAAFEGDIVRLRELLDAGEHDINGFDKHGNTPLILALHFKKNDCVQELLAKGADSGLKTKAGWSPIRYAVASAHIPNIRDIHRANINRERVNLLRRLPSMIEALKAVRTTAINSQKTTPQLSEPRHSISYLQNPPSLALFSFLTLKSLDFINI